MCTQKECVCNYLTFQRSVLFTSNSGQLGKLMISRKCYIACAMMSSRSHLMPLWDTRTKWLRKPSANATSKWDRLHHDVKCTRRLTILMKAIEVNTSTFQWSYRVNTGKNLQIFPLEIFDRKYIANHAFPKEL